MMSAPRMKRLSKMSLRASADRKKFEGVEKPLRTFSLVTFFCKKRPLANASGYFFRNHFLLFSELPCPKLHRQCQSTLHQVQLNHRHLMGSEHTSKLLRSLLEQARRPKVRLTKL